MCIGSMDLKTRQRADPMDYSLPGSSVHGILQVRILAWVAIPFSRGSSNSGIEPRSPALQVDSLPSELQGSPRILEWVAHPFSSWSSQPKNLTGVSCIAGVFFTSWATREAPMSSSEVDKCNYILTLNNDIAFYQQLLIVGKNNYFVHLLIRAFCGEMWMSYRYARSLGQLTGWESGSQDWSPVAVASLLGLPQYDTQILSFSICAIVWKWLGNTTVYNRKTIWITDSNPLIKCYKQQKIVWNLPATIRLLDVDS